MLYLLSAMPGTGKSTFIRENGLDAITLSLDTFRHMYAGPATDISGKIVLSNNREDLVFNKYSEALNIRMMQGGPIVIDNLNPGSNSFDYIEPLLEKYAYDYRVVRFPLQDFQFYIDRNNGREPYKQINENTLKLIYDNFTRSEFKDRSKIIPPQRALKEILATPNELIQDLNQFNRIHFIGDLQGCYMPIQKYLAQEGGFKRDEFYLFVGDYIDRGIQNDKCLRFILDQSRRDQSNVVFLAGNHEDNLFNHAFAIKKPADVFLFDTLPQLEKAGFTMEDMREVCSNLDLYHFGQYRDKKIMTNHAGLTGVPLYPRMLSADEYKRGFGPYNYNVDQKFEELNQDNEWYQVHGHRNSHKLTFDSLKKSFALECDVEYGGNLPVLRLNSKGFNGVYIQNTVFDRKEVLRKEQEAGLFESKNLESKVGDFLKSKLDMTQSNLETMKALRSNELIRESRFESLPHISSFNFKREAFFDKRFDDELVIHARGLFINNQTGEIVARGFEKFFNVNERGIESAKMENMKATFKPPIQLYQKDNGFLGILGYDSFKNNLVFASKSNIGGEFAGYFEDIARKQFNSGELEFLKIYANKHNVNYIFEVNDPKNDPHIIEYDKPHIVLLAVVKREMQFSQLTYEKLVEFAAEFKDMPVKQSFARFDNLDNFEKFYNAVSKESALTTKRKLEGWVVQDSDLNMIKIKLPYYSFWKCMRDMGVRLDKNIEKGVESNIDQAVDKQFLIKEQDKPFAKQFLKDFSKLSAEDRKLDIITLRNRYLGEEQEIKPVVNKPKNKL